MNTTGVEEEKRPIPPIRRSVWILLKKYALEKTKKTGKQIFLSEVLEEAILKLANSDLHSETGFRKAGHSLNMKGDFDDVSS